MGGKVASKVEKYIKLRLFFKCCLACREHQIKSLSIVSIQIFLDDFLKIGYQKKSNIFSIFGSYIYLNFLEAFHYVF